MLINPQKFNNYTSGSSETTEPQEVQNTDFKKFKNQTSRSSETELAEVQKPDPNYTDYNYTDYSQTENNQTNNNYTDMSDTNPINQSVRSMDSKGTQEKDNRIDEIDAIDETDAYMALIRKIIIELLWIYQHLRLYFPGLYPKLPQNFLHI